MTQPSLDGYGRLLGDQQYITKKLKNIASTLLSTIVFCLSMSLAGGLWNLIWIIIAIIIIIILLRLLFHVLFTIPTAIRVDQEILETYRSMTTILS